MKLVSALPWLPWNPRHKENRLSDARTVPSAGHPG